MERWPVRSSDSVAIAGHQLRRATPEDELAIQALFEADPAFFELSEGAPPRPNEARELADELLPGMPAEAKELYVIEHAAGPCAVVDLLAGYPDPQTWYLGLIFVAPYARGRGLGSALLEAMVTHVIASGGIRIRLAVVVDNHDARRLYNRLGFEFVDRRLRKTWTGVAIECDVLERWLMV